MTSLKDPRGEYQFARPSHEEHHLQCSSYAVKQPEVEPQKKVNAKFSNIIKKSNLRFKYNEEALLSRYMNTVEEEEEDQEAKLLEEQCRAKRRAMRAALGRTGLDEEAWLLAKVVDIMMSHELDNPTACMVACGRNELEWIRQRDNPNEEPVFEVPFQILLDYQMQKLPRCLATTHRLLRPLVFLDLQVLGTKSLGRIVVELYTEACPAVVLEFVRRCAGNQHELFQFRQSIPLLWLEAEIRPKPPKKPIRKKKAICHQPIEYDMRALDHGSGCNILSFAVRHVKTFPQEALPFSFSYNPLPAMNGTRVAFGAVMSGLAVLNFMQKFALLYDDDMKRFVVRKCGLIDR